MADAIEASTQAPPPGADSVESPTAGPREQKRKRDRRTRRTALTLVGVFVTMILLVGIYENDHPRNYQVLVINDRQFPVHLTFTIDGRLTFNGTLQEEGSYTLQGSDPWYVNNCTDHVVGLAANATTQSSYGGFEQSYYAAVGTCPNPSGDSQIEISLSQFY